MADPSGGTPPPAIGGRGGGNTVATGSTKTFGGYVYQWDGSQWYNTGVRDESPSGQPPLTYDQQLALATAPRSSTSTSSSTSNSYSHADPAQLQNQLDIATQQHTDAMAQLDETIRNNKATQASNAALLNFNQSKESYAEAVGNQDLALQAQQQAFGQQQAIVGLQLQAANIETQRAQISAQFQLQKTQALASLATQIGQTAQNPLDYGKYVSTLLASKGAFGDTAKETGNNITSNSLAPLQSLLNDRAATQANQGPQFSPINLGTIMPTTNGVPQAQTGGGGSMSAFDQINAQNAVKPTQQNTDALVAGNQGALGALLRAGYTPANTNANGQIPAAADGGMMKGAYISGEEGPELNIPNFMGTGSTAIINAKQAKSMGIDLKQIVSSKGKNGMAMYANGGIFDASSILNGSGDTSGASDFVKTALSTATANTPWNNGYLPTAVAASSPGTSPIVGQLLGSLRQLAGYEPADETARLAQEYAPNGYHFSSYSARFAPVGRTA